MNPSYYPVSISPALGLQTHQVHKYIPPHPGSVCAHMHVCREPSRSCFLRSAEPAAKLACQNVPKDFPSLSPMHWSYRWSPLYPDFHLGARDLNSGPYAYAASRSPSGWKLSSQPLKNTSSGKDRKVLLKRG